MLLHVTRRKNEHIKTLSVSTTFLRPHPHLRIIRVENASKISLEYYRKKRIRCKLSYFVRSVQAWLLGRAYCRPMSSFQPKERREGRVSEVVPQKLHPNSSKAPDRSA